MAITLTLAKIFKPTVATATAIALGAALYLAFDWRSLGVASTVVLVPNLLLFAMGIYAQPIGVRAFVQFIASVAVIWRAVAWWIFALNSDKGGALSVAIYFIYEAFAILVFGFVIFIIGFVSRMSSDVSPSNSTVETDARRSRARGSP